MPAALCQAVGCTCEVGRGQFMHRDHWFGLPVPLRHQINNTWRARKKAQREGGIRSAAAAIIAHVEACDEARRWTAEGEGKLADYRPDAERIARLYATVEQPAQEHP